MPSVTVSPSFRPAITHLRRRDPVLRRIIDHVGPCTLRRSGSLFSTLLEAIVWQQLSWKAANAIHGRALRAMATTRPTPRDVLNTSLARLRAAGLSQRKAEYLHELARACDAGTVRLSRMRALSDAEVVDVLTGVRGIGPWSAEMFLIFGLRRLDVFPAGDLGLRKAIARHYRRGRAVTPRSLARITDAWRPYRTVASWYIWAAADGVPFE